MPLSFFLKTNKLKLLKYLTHIYISRSLLKTGLRIPAPTRSWKSSKVDTDNTVGGGPLEKKNPL